MSSDYVHGYSERESERLYDQASTLMDMLHGDTKYPSGSLVLEAGCGVGAQTRILAKNNPEVSIVSVDISPESIRRAQSSITREGVKNVSFQVADIFNLPFASASFDHVFVCFVLEHLQDPKLALRSLKRVLKKGGSITVIEGDHGSAYFYPESEEAIRAIECLIKLQSEGGGNSKIGRQLYPLLTQAGYTEVRVSPRNIYVDASRPELVEGFTKRTFNAMVEEVGEQAISRKMIEERIWKKGIEDLNRTAEGDGTFSYTFFKAVGKN